MRKIKNGYILQARKTDWSEIAHKPPHFREIFNWLYRQANHKENKGIKRGQCVRSYKDIREGLKWYVGYRKTMYTKNHCETAMRWLTKNNMVHTTKTTRGMLITICNYEFYQNPKNYEKYNETYKKHTRNIQPVDTINKNDKNDKNDNKQLRIDFEKFWKLYPARNGKKLNKKKAYEQFKKISSKNYKELRIGVTNYAKAEQKAKDAFRWLRDKCWEDWQEPETNQTDNDQITELEYEV